MAVTYSNIGQRTVYYQKSTTNQSFLNMHYYLKETGISNNKFMLILFDPDLAGVDPHDRRLSVITKQKITREIMSNYWYFLREVVRIPDSGSTGGGTKYELHRGNMALNFCFTLNLDIFLELPRQQYKTVSALCRYLYLFNFGTSNSEMAFLNKRMDDSKLNLSRLKELREALPSYLRMDQQYSRDGKIIKAPNTVETLQHPLNNNKIRTVPSARNKVAAASLLRGRTLPFIWADEFAFIPYNDIIYINTVPAYKTAQRNAARNRSPYGMLITTTPGFLTDAEGKYAYETKEYATPFDESWYDKSYIELQDILNANQTSNFVYIKYTYQQLGRDEAWFRSICKDMHNQWPDIRREVLLEWSHGSTNCPFTQEDLDIVSQLVKQPIRTIYFLGKYLFNIYEEVNLKYPPIIGVDVSGGFNRDSSAISCITSNTTKLFADFNCNYISPIDLAGVVYELVTKYMPNAVVNVERNGGYGASVLAKLIGSSIKRNLYYEIKDKVIEERQEGNRIIRKSQKTKVYGLDSTKNTRELLIQILRDRMEYHKDKFVSPIIYNELRAMEIKRNGRVEHSANSHDDQVFSLLMALYVWYEGKNLAENFGIQKSVIKTDEDLDEAITGFEEKYGNVLEDIEFIDNDEEVGAYKSYAEAKKAQGVQMHEFLAREAKKEEDALRMILSTKPGREAYSKKYNEPLENLEQSSVFEIPMEVFTKDGYEDPSEEENMFMF